jgi:hypothetical protein
MENCELRPRETASNNASPGIRAPRKRFDPTQLFAQRDRLPWFWFLVAVAVTVGAAIDRLHLVNQFKQRERVVIIDPAQTYYISPLLQFQEARELHAQQAELVAMTFLSRNPKEFDHPDLLRQVFLKPALEKAQEHRQQHGRDVHHAAVSPGQRAAKPGITVQKLKSKNTMIITPANFYSARSHFSQN